MKEINSIIKVLNLTRKHYYSHAYYYKLCSAALRLFSTSNAVPYFLQHNRLFQREWKRRTVNAVTAGR